MLVLGCGGLAATGPCWSRVDGPGIASGRPEDDEVSVAGSQFVQTPGYRLLESELCGVPWGAVSEDQLPHLSLFLCFALSSSVSTWLSLSAPLLAPDLLFPLKHLLYVCILYGAGAWGLWALLMGKTGGPLP